jgi:hypothetical protein
MGRVLRIFLDDLRPAPEGWVLVKTAEECLDLLAKNKGLVSSLSLDHDLGDQSEDEKHGYWFVKQMVERGLYADVINLHTSNPVGRENMLMYLLNAIDFEALPSYVRVLNCPPAGYLENVENGWYDREE